MNYRPDIDGLRAVAILSVLGFHAKSSWVPGGFVGVDVFFVISGYLITGIILRGLDKGTFSFAEFYSRRIKRLFPALSVVLIFVLVVGWYSLYTDEYEELGKHIAAGAAYLSNVILWREAGYFDRAASFKPLLHLWSLGIEEQFYIIWPLLLFLSWKRRLNLLAVTLSIAFISFVTNIGRVAAHPVSTFYLPLPRFWELMMGGALAYAQVFKKEISRSALTRWFGTAVLSDSVLAQYLMAGTGAILIVIAVGCLNKHDLFPGWWALLPTCGTSLLIAAGPEVWINRTILGNRVMVFIGVISYPLYLWHWPLLSFERILGANREVQAASLVLSFVLAWLTHRYVEKPVRYNRFKLKPVVMLVSVVVCIGIIGELSFCRQIMPRSSRYGFDKFIAASTAIPYPGPRLRHLSSNYGDLLQEGKGPSTVLFIGDSNIEQYYPRIDRLLTNKPLGTKRVVFCTEGGCPPIPDVRENHHPHCEEIIERAIQYARNPQVDTIVIGADWLSYFVDPDPVYSYYFDDGITKTGLLIGSSGAEKAFAVFEKMISDFVRRGKKVFIVLQMPTGEAFDPRGMIRRKLRIGSIRFKVKIPSISRKELVEQAMPVTKRLRAIAARTGASVIDPMDWLCNGATCPTITTDGMPTHKDGAHLNPSYVRDHVNFLDYLLFTRK
jgi:peptidoglycan/LPS O-acetylase OafA/YrhL